MIMTALQPPPGGARACPRRAARRRRRHPPHHARGEAREGALPPQRSAAGRTRLRCCRVLDVRGMHRLPGEGARARIRMRPPPETGRAEVR